MARGGVLVVLLQLVCSRNNGVGRLPMLGWSTWCTSAACYQPGVNKSSMYRTHDVCSEGMVKSVATAMLSNGMHAAGYRHIHLDDCWGAMARLPNGSMTWDTNRFPSGLPTLIQWLHDRDFLFGLYTSAGNETCSTGGRSTEQRGIPGSCPSPNNTFSAVFCQESYDRDASTFASWNVDFIKLDWCIKTPTGTGSRADRFTTPHGPLLPELTGAFAAAMNKTGRAMWLNFHCDGAYMDWCAQDGNTWRIGRDHHDNWDSTAEVIEVLKSAAPHSGFYRWGDPDLLMTGGAGCGDFTPGRRCPGMTNEEYRTEFSLWAIASAPLIVSTDVRNLSVIQKEILLNKDLIAVQQDPLGIAGGLVLNYSCSSSNPPNTGTGRALCQIWSRVLSGGSRAVALYNPDDHAHNISVDLDALFAQHRPFSSRRRPSTGAKRGVLVQDLWHRMPDVVVSTGPFTAQVPSHGAVVLKLKPCQ